jgi:hypothetical protein
VRCRCREPFSYGPPRSDARFHFVKRHTRRNAQSIDWKLPTLHPVRGRWVRYAEHRSAVNWMVSQRKAANISSRPARVFARAAEHRTFLPPLGFVCA